MINCKLLLINLILLITFLNTLSGTIDNTSVGFNKIVSDFSSGKITRQEAVMQKIYYGFDKAKLKPEYKISSDIPAKCATGILIDYYQNKNLFSTSQQNEIESYFKKSSFYSLSAFSYISPSGKFELTYDVTGDNAVPSQDANNNDIPDYVEKIAEYFDHSWSVLIDTLLQLPIPLGEQKYQIGFEDMGYYGYTDMVSVNPRLTRIVMHNNYIGFPTNDDPEGDIAGAAKATAIHEFKHAVQFVYSLWNEPDWFVEMDATWSEDIGYDYVNDYYNYLGSSQIRMPGRSWAEGSGYEDCLWLHYLSEKHGTQINKEIWERLAGTIESIYISFDIILSDYSSSLSSGITEFFVWNFLCGNQANLNLVSYGEAAQYPTPTLCEGIKSIPDTSDGCNRSILSANFLNYQSKDSDEPLNFNFYSSNVNNNIALILNYVSDSSSIEFFEVTGSELVYLANERLSELENFAVIPVVTDWTGSNFDYILSVIPFKSAVFTHTPLKDTEDGTAVEFNVKVVTPLNIAVIDSLKLNYSVNDSPFLNTFLETSNSENEYHVTLTDLGTEVSIKYYFSIYDTLNNYLYFPGNAPVDFFTFYIGKDLIPPVINYTQMNTIKTKYNFPEHIFVEITDNVGIDSAFLEHTINHADFYNTTFVQFKNDLYHTEINIDSSGLNVGQSIYYRIHAVDKSQSQNTTIDPFDGFYEIQIADSYLYSSSPNLFVPDNNTPSLKDTITIADDILIEDVDIYFKATHKRFSDLEVRLDGPTGATRSLFSRPGLGTKFENAKNPDIIFDQDAFLSMINFELVDSTTAVGSFVPQAYDLNFLKEKNAKGNWIIYIYDRRDGEQGTIDNWGLIIRGTKITGVSNEINLPASIELFQNYPNPFNPNTKIKYHLNKNAHVVLKIFDVLGREIQKLVDKNQNPGLYEIKFEGQKLSSGIYYYSLKVDELIEIKKMVLLK